MATITMDPQVAARLEELREAQRRGEPLPPAVVSPPRRSPTPLPPRIVNECCRCSGTLPHSTLDLRTSLAATRSFAELCPFVRNATTSLTFWGTRQVHIAGYEETLPIDALTQRVIDLIEQAPDFDQNERSHGKTIARQIDQIYNEDDRLYRESHLITKIFIFFRHVFSWICSFCSEAETYSSVLRKWAPPNDRWGDSIFGYGELFFLYTRHQYESHVGPLSPTLYPAGLPLSGRDYWAAEGRIPPSQTPDVVEDRGNLFVNGMPAVAPVQN